MFLALDPAWGQVGAALVHGLLLIVLWRSGSHGLLRAHLVLTAVAGLLAGLLLASGILDAAGGRSGPAVFLVELFWTSSWFLLLLRLLRGPYGQSMPGRIHRGLWSLWTLFVLLAGGACWYWYLRWPAPEAMALLGGTVLAAALLCVALAAQLGRDAPVEGRDAQQLLVLATALAGGSQAVLMGMFLLTSELTPAVEWLRSLAMAAAAAALLRTVSLRPQWSLETFVSPQARTYLPRLMAMAGVLVVLLVARPFHQGLAGGSAQPMGFLLIGFGAPPVLMLLFSERLSARLRVFLSKHFFPFRYNYREEWLRLTATLAAAGQSQPLPERAIKAVAQIVGSPAGLLWMREGPGGQFACTAAWNTRLWSEARVPADDPATTFMLERQWIVDTAELFRDPAMYDGMQRPGWLDRFPEALLLVPLISNQELIGFMLLLQPSSAFRLTFEEIDLLRTSGRQVAAHLAQHEAHQRLAEVRQFEAFNRLTAFMMHDLKNLIAQQSLVVRNAARHKDNPAFIEDAIATIDNSVARMNKLLQQLQSGEAGRRQGRVKVMAVLEEAASRCRGRRPEPRLRAAEGSWVVSIDRERLAMVATHLMRNAQEATDKDGRVDVSVDGDDRQVVITISDDGCGMNAEFIRTRLFRPFDSTKGSQGMGIGVYQARSLILESGGSLDVASVPNEGTRITIRLPLADDN